MQEVNQRWADRIEQEYQLVSQLELEMETVFGGRRMVDWLSGEQLPRIC